MSPDKGFRPRPFLPSPISMISQASDDAQYWPDEPNTQRALTMAFNVIDRDALDSVTN